MPSRDESPEPLSMPEMAALTQMFEQYGPRLRAMLERRIDPRFRARLDAESLLQDTYLLARRRWSRFPASGMTPLAWLYRLAFDCLLEAWKHENRDCRDPRREQPWPDHSSAQLGLELLGSVTTPSRALARKEVQEMMRAALAQLDEDERQVLWMRHLDKLKLREIASILAISEDAASKRYARALKQLEKLVPDAFKPDGSNP